MFGFNLMRNFNYPYFSRSIPEFWRRWHISLTTWFRDYIYFPLGGSRCNKWKIIRNVFIVWGISGLWHGANWTFICWGLYHAILLAIYNVFGINSKYKNVVAFERHLPNFKEFMQIVMTFFLAVIGWIIFRAESMPQAVNYLSAMVTNKFFDTSFLCGKANIAYCILLLFVEWLQRDKQHALQWNKTKIENNKWIQYVVDYVVILLILLLGNFQGNQFIYFQF